MHRNQEVHLFWFWARNLLEGLWKSQKDNNLLFFPPLSLIHRPISWSFIIVGHIIHAFRCFPCVSFSFFCVRCAEVCMHVHISICFAINAAIPFCFIILLQTNSIWGGHIFCKYNPLLDACRRKTADWFACFHINMHTHSHTHIYRPGSNIKHVPPLCVSPAVPCRVLSAPPHGSLSCSDPHGQFSFSSRCALTCDEGFLPNGTAHTECSSLGSWSQEVPLCLGKTR